VAMARAWILKPSILLMDEPSASVDQESIERLVVLAQDLLARAIKPTRLPICVKNSGGSKTILW